MLLPHIAIAHKKTTKGVDALKTPAEVEFFRSNCLDVMPVSDMLNIKHRTDAHFVCYAMNKDFTMWPRLNKSVLADIRAQGYDIVLNYFAFDWDNEDHSDWDETTLTAFLDKVNTVQDPIISLWYSFYTTKHGARFIYRLSDPIPVDVAEYHLAWMIQHFQNNGWSNIDSSCKDWTRLFRCPQVMRDGIATWEQDYFVMPTSQDVILPVSVLGKTTPAIVAKKQVFHKGEHLVTPNYNDIQGLVSFVDKKTGRTSMTRFYNEAKKALKTNPYYDVLFKDVNPGWAEGQRNNSILRFLGNITPILVKECLASVTQIFALAYPPLLTIPTVPGEKSWVDHAWNALLDIYERETEKLNREYEGQAKKAEREETLLDTMIEGMSRWNTHPVLKHDKEQAREYVRSHIMASVGTYFFMLGKDGYYEHFPINANQIVSRIRKSHLKDIIATEKELASGDMVDVTPSYLQNHYSTPVSDVVMKPVGDRGGYIQDLNGEKPELVLSTFSRNEELKPVYDPYVDGWLQCLFGSEYEQGCAWIGNALAFEEGLICALSLEGASNAGKKLLTIGLSECLKKPYIAGPLDIYGMSSAFLKTPFLVINEAWPDQKNAGISPADTFKALTGGDDIRVKEIYKPAMTIQCPVRVILTANDDGIIQTLTKGKDMTPENRKAIGERLFHIKVPVAAQEYLREIGGMAYTSKPGQRWIRPDSGVEGSNFVVARHFMWLYKNRKPVDGSQRFLVMGNSAPGCGEGILNVFERQLVDNTCTPLVVHAILDMLEKPAAWGKFYKIGKDMTSLHVTRFGVYKYITDVLNNRLTEREVFSSMRNLMMCGEPLVDNEGTHWYEVSIEVLGMVAAEKGIPNVKIRQMLNVLKQKRAV